MIKRAMNEPEAVRKEQKSLVFKTITEINNHSRMNSKAISLKDIRRKLDENVISNEEIGAAIKELDDEGHIHFDSQTEKIYM